MHSEGAGARWLDELGRAAGVRSAALRGLPANVLPLAVWHTASVGIDLWLAALAYGASRVWVLVTDEEAPAYRDALAAQAALANTLLQGLGHAGERVALLSVRDARDLAALDASLHGAPLPVLGAPATFAVQADKRATLDLALDHFIAHAPLRPEAVALPAGASPWGSLVVDAARCTLCLSCVGACPEAALADNPERPQLRFIEANCVQCGLCASTCPERAITLEPRLWLADGGRARRQPRVVAEAEPFACVRCGKPFGTLRGRRGDDRAPGRAFDVPGRRGRAAQDVRRLPRDRHPHQSARSADRLAVKTIALHPAAVPSADSEELARAEVYGLLAALLAAPPSAELYAQLQVAATEAPAAGGFLEASFGELVASARRLSRDAVGGEYDALFQGVGKPEVLLHASYYVAGSLNDTPLVALRDDLRALGLEPDPALATTEDHIACLCEVMRYLIAGSDASVATLAAQRRFFGAHLQGWTDALWDALAAHPRSDFFRAVAGFARAFFAVEAQAFEMLDAEES